MAKPKIRSRTVKESLPWPWTTQLRRLTSNHGVTQLHDREWEKLLEQHHLGIRLGCVCNTRGAYDGFHGVIGDDAGTTVHAVGQYEATCAQRSNDIPEKYLGAVILVTNKYRQSVHQIPVAAPPTVDPCRQMGENSREAI